MAYDLDSGARLNNGTCPILLEELWQKNKAKFIRQKKDKHVQALLTRYAWLLPLGVIVYDIR